MLTPIFEGYTFKESNGKEQELARVAKNIGLTYVYTNNVTGIEEVKTENGNVRNGIYDLTGRRVKTITTPGIYIVDGKKTMVK